jgi:hypothetical protein
MVKERAERGSLSVVAVVVALRVAVERQYQQQGCKLSESMV